MKMKGLIPKNLGSLKASDLILQEKKKAGPLTPNEITSLQAEVSIAIPEEVCAATNNLLIKHYNDQSGIATFTLAELVNESLKIFAANGKTVEEEALYDNKWLDVEKVYNSKGWFVEYDKPAYNETYPAKFIFHKTDSPRSLR